MSSKNEFLPPNDSEIIEILNIVNESDFDELHLEMSGMKLIFSKRAIEFPDQPLGPALKEAHRPGTREQPMPVESAQEIKTEMVAPPEGGPQKAGLQEHTLIEEEGPIPIKAPRF
jgi:hypothetical protein